MENIVNSLDEITSIVEDEQVINYAISKIGMSYKSMFNKQINTINKNKLSSLTL